MYARSVLGISLVFLGLIMAVLIYVANTYFLYWVFWWFDIVMHFGGGLLFGGFALWWIRYEVPVGIRSKLPKLVSTLVVVLIIGVSWEVFEYVTDSYNALNYTLDTAMDVAMDVVGGLAAYLVFSWYAK